MIPRGPESVLTRLAILRESVHLQKHPCFVRIQVVHEGIEATPWIDGDDTDHHVSRANSQWLLAVAKVLDDIDAHIRHVFHCDFDFDFDVDVNSGQRCGRQHRRRCRRYRQRGVGRRRQGLEYYFRQTQMKIKAQKYLLKAKPHNGY